jgi:hypothetical protein
MTLLGIPYNVVTALITALSIGIGVDYTIHVIHRFTEELEHGGSVEAATTTTLATTGSALLGSALTTALGFGVLLFSPLVPFQQFGLVTGITILFALIVAVAVVPPLMVVWAAYHEWRRRETSQAGPFHAPAETLGEPITAAGASPVPESEWSSVPERSNAEAAERPLDADLPHFVTEPSGSSETGRHLDLEISNDSPSGHTAQVAGAVDLQPPSIGDADDGDHQTNPATEDASEDSVEHPEHERN